MRKPWPVKTVAAVLWFALAMYALGYVPAFEQFGALRYQTLAAVFDFEGRAAGSPQSSGSAGQLIDRGGALDHFYAVLSRAEAREPGAVVRILHFGDSPITADQISADARSRLQERFGDAGQGFVLIAKPWAWYHHRGIGMAGRGWTIQAASQNFASDGLHGLGGATFEGGSGATSEFELSKAAQRVEISYWAEPGGGDFEVLAGGKQLGVFPTAARTGESDFAMVPLPPDSRDVRIRVVSGRVRLFGASFESGGPGVRYSNLGLNAAQIRTPLHHFDGPHWAGQLRHQQPDLVILSYGTNESGYPAYVDGAFANDLRELVRRVRQAVPQASVLIMSPMDRALRSPAGQIVTMPKLPGLIALERQVAAELGCAFFNTFQAMGGEGTMARWYEARPRLASADFMHPLPAGATLVGALLNEALTSGYAEFRTRALAAAAVRSARLKP